jgi:transketolase
MNTTTAEKKPRLTTSAMIASIASEGQAVRAAPFGKALVEYAATHREVVGLTADLAKYTDLHLFAQAYPDRFYQMGMAEQLLMGAAGGLAKEGLVPFATTYAVFGTRRAYDFIHQVIAEESLNVKICCALPGLTGYGPSHQATEDIAMMRGIPGLTIVDPCDALDIEQAVPQIAAHKGPVYMRLLRGQVPLVLDRVEGYKFELGKAKMLREGADVLVISSGLLTMRALEVAQDLAKDKIGVAVLHCPTIKPLDEAAIVEAVRYKHRLVVVAENHSVIGGLGEAVASALLRNRVQPAAFQLAGLPDAFLDAGALPTLHDRYGISREALGSRIRRWLA